MGIFDGIFKKKKSSLDFPEDGGLSGEPGSDLSSGLDKSFGGQDSNLGGFDSFGNPTPTKGVERMDEPISSFGTPASSSINSDMSKDIQLMIAKLDAIKAEVSHINQRVEIIERRLSSETQQPQQKRYTW